MRAYASILVLLVSAATAASASAAPTSAPAGRSSSAVVMVTQRGGQVVRAEAFNSRNFTTPDKDTSGKWTGAKIRVEDHKHPADLSFGGRLVKQTAHGGFLVHERKEPGLFQGREETHIYHGGKVYKISSSAQEPAPKPEVQPRDQAMARIRAGIRARSYGPTGESHSFEGVASFAQAARRSGKPADTERFYQSVVDLLPAGIHDMEAHTSSGPANVRFSASPNGLNVVVRPQGHAERSDFTFVTMDGLARDGKPVNPIARVNVVDRSLALHNSIGDTLTLKFDPTGKSIESIRLQQRHPTIYRRPEIFGGKPRDEITVHLDPPKSQS